MVPTTARHDDQGVDSFGPVFPFPFVLWTNVLEADDPSREPSRGRYRSLKNTGRSSVGIRVYPRGAAGVTGSDTVHSVLAVLALHAERDGDRETASRLRDSANQLEARHGTDIRVFLSHNSLGELESAPFFAAAMTSMKRALKATSWDRHVFAEGHISSVNDAWASITARTGDGKVSSVEMRRALMDVWHLTAGDPVLVFQRLLRTAAITEILPGVSDEVPSALEPVPFERSMWPERSAAEKKRLAGLIESGSVGRRTIRLTA